MGRNFPSSLPFLFPLRVGRRLKKEEEEEEEEYIHFDRPCPIQKNTLPLQLRAGEPLKKRLRKEKLLLRAKPRPFFILFPIGSSGALFLHRRKSRTNLAPGLELGRRWRGKESVYEIRFALGGFGGPPTQEAGECLFLLDRPIACNKKNGRGGLGKVLGVGRRRRG